MAVFNAGLLTTASCEPQHEHKVQHLDRCSSDYAQQSVNHRQNYNEALTRMRSSMPATSWYRVLLDTARKPPQAMLFCRERTGSAEHECSVTGNHMVPSQMMLVCGGSGST